MATSVSLKKGRSRTVGGIWWRVVLWIILIITTVISLFPLYWLFITAFTPTKETIKTPPDLLPFHASLENFDRLFSTTKYYWNWAFNTFVIAIAITLFHVVFDTMAGYAFAKKKFPGRTLLFWLVLSTIMIPPQVTLTPLYFVVQNFNLRDNLLAVILPGTANVFGIFLMRQFIQTMPTELEEAGRIDGCSEFGVFWRIIAPLCKPAIGALAIFTFVRYWNDYLWPSLVLIRAPSQTLSVGVASLQSENSTDYGLIFSGAALAALPMILFFLAFQRYFLEGVRMGALKG